MSDILSLDFPIVKVLPEFLKAFDQENTIILKAETGAGKSTILPLSLLEHAKSYGEKIIMLEPRRLATKSIAKRMADLLGEELGKTIGYSIRFESAKSEESLIEVVTEGILTRMLVDNPELKGYSTVIFDEFHERSIHADLGLALTRAIQQNTRPDLKVVIMSATLNEDYLAKSLKAKIINSKGRSYPVSIQYVGESADRTVIEDSIAHQVVKAINTMEGDVLVFLPGQGEIMRVQELLKRKLNQIKILPLYGQLPWHKQQQAILPDSEGKRKVVLATSIAETSLTIEGVKIVIDSGLGRHSIYDAKKGLSRLVTEPISKDEADQRSGRAGRIAEGTCFRMWSEIEHKHKRPHRLPEVLVNDLSPLMLDLYAKNIHPDNYQDQLFWVTPPPADKLIEADKLLNSLEAIENGKITNLGKAMNQLPCHPRLAHMLKHPMAHDNMALATDLAAILEEKDTFYQQYGADVSARLELLHQLREEKRLSKSLKKIEQIAKSYRKLLDVEIDNSAVDSYAVGFLLALAYPDRIATAKRGNNAQFQLANGAIAAIGHKDELAAESWLAVASMDARQGLGKIFLAAPLNPKDLMPLVKSSDNCYWNIVEEEFELREELSIGSIVLKSEPIDDEPDNAEKKQAIIKVIQEDDELLQASDEFDAFCREIELLRSESPDEGWPEMNIGFIKMLAKKWVSDELINQPNLSEKLSKLDLVQTGLQLLSEKQRKIYLDK